MAKYLDQNGVSKLWTKIKTLLNGKANTNHTHSASQVSGLASVATSGSYNDLSNKPTIPASVTVDSALSSTSTNPVQNKVINSALSGKADTGHKHMMSTISGLESALYQKANTNHTHTIANITNLQSSLDGKLNVQDPSFNGTIYGAKWSGQAGTSSDNHAIIIGANQKDYCDFLEYGAVWNFYKSIEGTKTLVAKIQEDGIYHNNTKLSLEGHEHKVADVEGLAYDLQVRPTRDDFYSNSESADDEDYLTKAGVRMCVLTELAGQKNGVASLGADGKVPTSQLPTSSGGLSIELLDFFVDGGSSTTIDLSGVKTARIIFRTASGVLNQDLTVRCGSTTLFTMDIGSSDNNIIADLYFSWSYFFIRYGTVDNSKTEVYKTTSNKEIVISLTGSSSVAITCFGHLLK